MVKKEADSGPNNEAELVFRYFNEIGIISQLSSKMFESALPDGLTNAQFSVLNWFIRVDDEATPGRLATAFQVTAGAMTNTLKKLESKQLIKISPDPTSGRKKKVVITAKGRRCREHAIAAAAPLMRELTETLDFKELSSQLPALERLREYLDRQRD